MRVISKHRTRFREAEYGFTREQRLEKDMTVCLAALFTWNYAKKGDPVDLGIAAITASDRQITVGDSEYEPPQPKFTSVTDQTRILIAGDYTVHSEAIKATMDQVRADPSRTPYNIALTYGAAIQAVRRRHAEAMFLAPIGLNTDTLVAQQKDLSDGYTIHLTTQMQEYEGSDVQAIVVGMEDGNAHLYVVDKMGAVRSFDDVGFAAIGIGSWHARSRFMLRRYVKSSVFAEAAITVFAAKAAAEVSPGVGRTTDFDMILRFGAFPLWPKVKDKVKELYDLAEAQKARLETQTVDDLQAFINDPKNHT